MRLSFLNIQNLFFRDESLEKIPRNNPSGNWMMEMDQLMEKIKKGKRELHRIEELSLLLGFQRIAKQRHGTLKNRGGQLYLKEGIMGPMEKANESTNWQGWMKIRSSPTHQIAIRNKIRLLAELSSDLVILQEVEDRYALVDFLKKGGEEFLELYYPHIHVLEGEDPRGIEQACLYKKRFQLNYIAPIEITLDKKIGKAIHYDFKHKEYGRMVIISVYLLQGEIEDIESPRKELMIQLASYYEKLRAQAIDNILVLGTFRAPGYCYSLAPLLRETDLKDISTLTAFKVQLDSYSGRLHYPATAVKEVTGKKDFFLVSPDLTKRIKAAGLNWSGRYWSNKSNFKSYPSITSRNFQASDHPGLWIEFY